MIERVAREGEVDADRRARAVERQEQQARDDRRQRERKVDQRVQRRSSPEVVPDEHPGRHRPEHGVRERGERGDGQRELQGGNRLGRRDGVPERRPASLFRLPEERRDRERDDDEQERRGIPEREGRSDLLARDELDYAVPLPWARLGVARQFDGPPTAASIPYIRPFGCANHRACAAAYPPSVLSFSVI